MNSSGLGESKASIGPAMKISIVLCGVLPEGLFDDETFGGRYVGMALLQHG
jgi:hypothetical protein